MSIQEFFNTYYVEPLVNPHTGIYNIFNTLTYGIILALMAFVVYKVLRKMKIPIDRNFFIATLPYILLAAVFRVLRDADIYYSKFLVSPLLYITVFALAFSILVSSVGLSYFYPKIKYYYPMFIAGFFLLIIYSLKLNVINSMAAVQILSLTVFSLGLIVLFGRLTKMKVFSNLNLGILGSSMFDSSSTVVGILLYGYAEKHVLPSLLIASSTAWIMFPLKFFVVLLALWVIDDSDMDIFFKNFMKFAILCITLGPGARNTLRLMMGV